MEKNENLGVQEFRSTGVLISAKPQTIGKAVQTNVSTLRSEN